MASGSFTITTTNQFVEGRCYWDAWADAQNNKSRINVSVFFYRTNYGFTTQGDFDFVLYSSFGEQARSGTRNWKFTNPNGGQGTQVISASWDQPHDSNGDLRFRLSVAKTGDVFWLNNNGGDVIADKIARQSTVSSTPQAYLGDDIWIDINRANSSYTHTVHLITRRADGSEYVINTQTNVGTRAYYSVSTDADLRRRLATALDRRGEAPLFARCETYNNGVKVGSTTAGGVGRVIRHNLAFVAVSTNVISQSTPATLANYNGKYTFEVYCVDHGTYNGVGAPPSLGDGNIRFKKRIEVASDKFNIAFNSTEQTQLYNIIPTTDRRMMTYQVIMRMEGVQVNNDSDMWSNGSYSIDSSIAQPIFSGSFPVTDSNGTSTAITNNSRIMIQGISNAYVVIPVANRAQPFTGASILRYEAVVNGVTVTANYSTSSDVRLNIGVINTNTDTTCSINAVDSRGYKRQVTSNVSVLPYAPPTIFGTGARDNSFEEGTTLTATGTLSPLRVGSANKNAVELPQHRSKELGAASTTWTAWKNFDAAPAGVDTFNHKTRVVFNTNLNYEVQMRVKDKLSGYVQVNIVVSKGKPIAFMDAKTQALGVNMVPSGDRFKLQVDGGAFVKGTIRAGAIVFPKIGSPHTPTSPDSDYNSFWLYNDTIQVDNNIIFRTMGGGNIRLGGELYSKSEGGTYLDQYGNIIGQSGNHRGSAWSVKDADGSIRLLIPMRRDSDYETQLIGINRPVRLIAENAPVVLQAKGSGADVQMFKDSTSLFKFTTKGNGDKILFSDGKGIIWSNAGANGNGTIYLENGENGGPGSRMDLFINKLYSNHDGTVGSKREYKQDIEKYDLDSWEIVKNADVFKYNYRKEYEEPSHNKTKKMLGVMANDLHSSITNDKDDAVVIYAMISTLWDATQRLIKQNEGGK